MDDLEENEIKIKEIDSFLAATIEGDGKIPDFNKDVDKLYEYLYSHGYGELICGPTIGLFYTEHGGKYIVAAPVKTSKEFSGGVKLQTLPAIRCTSLLHTESAETIEESFNKLKKYRKKHKIEWVFPVREVYFPSEDKEGKYLIEIQVPIT